MNTKKIHPHTVDTNTKVLYFHIHVTQPHKYLIKHVALQKYLNIHNTQVPLNDHDTNEQKLTTSTTPQTQNTKLHYTAAYVIITVVNGSSAGCCGSLLVGGAVHGEFPYVLIRVEDYDVDLG